MHTHCAPVLRQAEGARLGVSGLRQRRHAADLHKPKPEAQQRLHRLASLVKPRGHACSTQHAEAAAPRLASVEGQLLDCGGHKWEQF